MDEMYGAMDANRYGADGGNWQWGPQGQPPQEDLKTTRKHFSKLGGMFMLGALVIYAVQLVPMLLVSYLMPEWVSNGDIYMMISMLPMYIIGMPVLILLVKLVPGVKVESHKMGPGKFIVSAIMCFALVYLCNIVGSLFTFIIGLLKGGTVNNQVADMTSSISMWTIFFFMVLCAPIMEELVFRKLIVERTVRYGQGVAVLLSGLMFGLFHGNLNQFAYTFTLGAFLAFLYVKTGNIKITIGLHMMINFVGGFVSSGLTRMLDLDEYTWAMASGDMELIMNFVYNNLLPLLLYISLAVFVIGMLIAGGILFIVSIVKNKFTFARGAVVIPKGKRFRTVILNVGMLCYIIFWVVMILIQLFQ